MNALTRSWYDRFRLREDSACATHLSLPFSGQEGEARTVRVLVTAASPVVAFRGGAVLLNRPASL